MRIFAKVSDNAEEQQLFKREGQYILMPPDVAEDVSFFRLKEPASLQEGIDMICKEDKAEHGSEFAVCWVGEQAIMYDKNHDAWIILRKG